MSTLPPIFCLACNKQGQYGDVHGNGWRLAPNRLGGYTCSIPCDNLITAYDEAKKQAEKQAKKDAKKKG